MDSFSGKKLADKLRQVLIYNEYNIARDGGPMVYAGGGYVRYSLKSRNWVDEKKPRGYIHTTPWNSEWRIPYSGVAERREVVAFVADRVKQKFGDELVKSPFGGLAWVLKSDLETAIARAKAVQDEQY
jgi:hypothetical protein